MTERVSAGRTARLLLRYRRDPARYLAEACRPDAPALDFDVVLRLAQGREVAFGQTSLEDASPEALAEAAKSYLLKVCFRPDATPYQTLGLEPDATADDIKERFRVLMQLVHPDRHGAGTSWPSECAAQASRAYTLLRHPESRAKFDRERRERFEQERASKQAAVAAAASMPPSRDLPRAVRTAHRPPPQPVLPEWLTAGVGGFVRRHPAGVAFGALVAASVLVAGFALWESESASLTRGGAATAGAEVSPAAAAVALAKRDTPRAPAFADAHEGGSADARETAPAPPAAARVAPSPPEIAPARVPARAEIVAAETASSPGTPIPSRAPAAASVAAPAAVAPATTAPRPEPAPRVFAPMPPAVATEPSGGAPAAPAGVAVPPVAPAPAAPAPAAPAPVAIAPAQSGPSPGAVAMAPATEAPAARALPVPVAPAAAIAPEASPRAPGNAEIESLFAAFVDAYDRGRADAFALLFDRDARANQHQGRAAIRGEYDDVFRRSEWRRMQVVRMNWRRVGDTAQAKGEIAVRVGLRDGREHEERMSVDMELVRRDGRLVITRLDQRPGAP